MSPILHKFYTKLEYFICLKLSFITAMLDNEASQNNYHIWWIDWKFYDGNIHQTFQITRLLLIIDDRDFVHLFTIIIWSIISSNSLILVQPWQTDGNRSWIRITVLLIRDRRHCSGEQHRLTTGQQFCFNLSFGACDESFKMFIISCNNSSREWEWGVKCADPTIKGKRVCSRWKIRICNWYNCSNKAAWE